MTAQSGPTETIISLTAAGTSQAKIAEAAGLSIRTVRRRQQETRIAAAVREARYELEQQAVGTLASLRAQAFTQLETLTTSDDPMIVLRVCKLILDQGLAYRAALVEDQLSTVEGRILDLRNPSTSSGQR